MSHVWFITRMYGILDNLEKLYKKPRYTM